VDIVGSIPAINSILFLATPPILKGDWMRSIHPSKAKDQEKPHTSHISVQSASPSKPSSADGKRNKK